MPQPSIPSINHTKRLSPDGLSFIKHFEGCKLTAYQDGGKIWTIGFGHTKNVTPGMVMTQEQADACLAIDTVEAQANIIALVKVPLSQNQFDALTSFVFNIGCENFRSSTLLKLLNTKNYKLAADQFLRWDHIGTEVSAGLQKRREAERALFLSEDGVPVPSEFVDC